ncbi:unnamed protein product, partial [marine sediment metagenome]
MDNHKSNGEIDETLYLKWNENLDYKVTVKSRVGQINAPVSLFIKVGALKVDQEKSTELSWYDAYVTVGAEYTFLSSAVKLIATCPINETDFLLVYSNDAVSDRGEVRVGRVADDGSISYGLNYNFCSDIGSGLGVDVCMVNDLENRFMIAYVDDGAGADDGFVFSSTFDDMVIDSIGYDKLEFETTDTEHPAIAKIRDDYAVVCYNDEGNSDTGQAIVVYWDGNTVEKGIAVELGSGTSGTPDLDPFYCDVSQLDTDKFVCGFDETES